jgi:membrane protease subunit HflC
MADVQDPVDTSAQSGIKAWVTRNGRIVAAAIIVTTLVISASVVTVIPGEAVVVTRVGNPVRVITTPGLVWKIPAPVESSVPVDLRLKTTSSGLQDVGTKDGLRVLMQAYVAWQVPHEPEHIRQFLRAVRNQPDIAAQQLRSFIASALEVTVSGFDLQSLVNADPSKVRLKDLEDQLRARVDAEALKVYGVRIVQVGVQRLTLPAETLNATVLRMQAERSTAAAEREAEGERAASEIIANADRDARVTVAQARAEASSIEAKARLEAAEIYRKTYNENRDLYTLLRSLDTLQTVINSNTTLILRTDSAPFRVLSDGPGRASGALPATIQPK